MNQSRYRKLADAAYDRVAESKDHFDIAEVVEEIARELSSEDASSELIREFAHNLAEKADDRRAKRADSGQIDLFTGEPEALDAVWRIGGGRRVKAKDAIREDVLAWLGIRRENADRVAAAFDRDRQVVAELLVFMPDLDTTVEQAVQARQSARRETR